MTSASSTDLNAMELEAVQCFSLSYYTEAEQLYRRILHARSEAEGPDAARRDQFNLACVLVKKQNFAEAEPLLREVLTFLESRSNRNRKHFKEQEAATMRLLAQALGKERADEARRLSEGASHLEASAASMQE